MLQFNKANLQRLQEITGAFISDPDVCLAQKLQAAQHLTALLLSLENANTAFFALRASVCANAYQSISEIKEAV